LSIAARERPFAYRQSPQTSAIKVAFAFASLYINRYRIAASFEERKYNMTQHTVLVVKTANEASQVSEKMHRHNVVNRKIRTPDCHTS
jgi:hypothetical protein